MPSRTSNVRLSPGESRIVVFELFDDAQRMQVVIESRLKAAHLAVEFLLAGVRERRMADVMHQGQRFGEVGIQFEDAGDGARDLRDLDACASGDCGNDRRGRQERPASCLPGGEKRGSE